MGDDPVWLVVTLALVGMLAAISRVDLRSYRIPDALSLPLIAAGLVAVWGFPALMPPGQVFADHLIGASGAFVLFAGLGWAIHRRTGREALGLGDAKLFAGAGAWLGWQALPAVLLIASLGGLAFALILQRVRGPSPVAFGPWIALGMLAVWLSNALR